MEEKWKPVNVEGYQQFYQVSNLGRVKSLDRVDRRGQLRKGRVLKQNQSNGYYFIGLRKDGKVKQIDIHRLVALTFLNNSENKPAVNHIDGNKVNNCVTNLEWVTHKENSEHAVKTGLTNISGENNGAVKLTEEEVKDIANTYIDTNLTIQQIADKFEVSDGTVSNIVTGRGWTHLFDKNPSDIKQEKHERFIDDIINEIVFTDSKYKEIASKFDVKVSYINGIAYGISYKHLYDVKPKLQREQRQAQEKDELIYN
ncbi:NUMOD4 domain-containing protein [Salsuginibacillus kocurii]|uniref:NUMOD4 domain-containing protein n=1 Tax=Salsuginibacillus kocurii TaxID=427078 RepID=UPI000368487A|nr:NUMOD4 domain-containing protein [Salsuginibacillus kocurii]